MLIKGLTTRIGRSLEIGRFTVLTGLSNVGKSECLRDIYRLLTNAEPHDSEPVSGVDVATIILGDLEYHTSLSYEEFIQGLRLVSAGHVDRLAQGLGANLHVPFQAIVNPEKCRNIFQRASLAASALRKSAINNVMFLRVAYLPTENRGALLSAAPAGNPAQPPANLLQALQFASEETRMAFDTAMNAIFGHGHLLLDDSQRVQLSLRIAAELPMLPADAGDTVRLLETLRTIENEGESFRNVAAVVATVLLSRGRVVLLDEPSSGLHPGESRRLGEWLADTAATTDSQVITATQDAEFLTGLQSRAGDISLLRVVRKGTVTRLFPIPPIGLNEVVSQPALVGQPVFQRLLRESAIIVESALEQTLSEALLDRLGRPSDVAVWHAHVAAALPQVAKALKGAMVPCCVVASVDLLGYEERLSAVVEALTGKPPQRWWLATREKLADHLNDLYEEQSLSDNTKAMEDFLSQLESGQAEAELADDGTQQASPDRVWAIARRRGLEVVPTDLRVSVSELLTELKKIGLFLVPGGTLANWICRVAEVDANSEHGIVSLRALAAGQDTGPLESFLAEVLRFLTAQLAVREAAETVARPKSVL